MQIHQHLRTTLFASLIAVPSISFAIVPIDTVEVPDQGWSGNVGLGLTGKNSSKDKQDYNVNLLLRHIKEERTALLITDYNYSETDDVKDEDDLFVHGRWRENNYFRPMLDWEIFTQYQYDKFDDLSSRALAGSGVRWRFEDDTESGKLFTSVGAGAFFEREESDSTGEVERNWRGNFYSKWVWNKLGSYPFTLYGLLYVQPVLDDLGDVRATGTAGIEFDLTKTLSLSAEVQAEFDSEPFEAQERTTTEYGLKLAYRF